MKQKLATILLRLFGWKAVGEAPTDPKVIIVCAPHTSNIDYILMVLVAATRNLRISFLGKTALFKPPLGWLIRKTGGIPVDRSAPQGLVGQLVDRFAEADRLALCIPAEGTRGRTEYWKSGFYRIAEAADLPISLAFIDRSSKTSGFGPTFKPSGDVVADMDMVREFYADKKALKPANFGPIRLRDEEIPPAVGQ